MSKKADPAVIGVFVIVAAAIAIGAILILGSGKLFKRTDPYVVFFNGSLAGLDVGAPVEFRGVRVGSVKQIQLVYNQETAVVTTPVYIELERGRMKYSGQERLTRGLVFHIKQGLRAQLQSQSFVTGKLKVMLVEAPDSPIIIVGGDPTVAEIPAVPGLLDSLAERLDKLPLDEIVTNLHATTQALADISESGRLEQIVEELHAGTEGLAKVVNGAELGEMLDELRVVTHELATIMESGKVGKILDELHAGSKALAEVAGSGSLGDMAHDLNAALDNLNTTLIEGGKLITQMNRGVTPLRHQTSKAVTELIEAARATRNLMEYLERHPEALVTGKEGE